MGTILSFFTGNGSVWKMVCVALFTAMLVYIGVKIVERDNIIKDNAKEINISSTPTIYVVNNGENITFQGNEYIAFPFDGCGYTGELLTCNKTLSDCRTRNNSKRFGGFMGVGSGYRV